jgi:hypothetical protein
MPVAYLAAPYSFKSKSKEIGLSKPDNAEQKEKVEQERYEVITEATARLFEAGITVISPITQTHPCAKYYGLGDKGLEFWLEHDFRLILRCDMLIVLQLKGWQESTGVTKEIQFCRERGIPIVYAKLENGQIILGG